MERELIEGNDFIDNELDMQEEFKKGMGPKRFRYGDLAVATDNFSDDNKLGQGGHGSSHRHQEGILGGQCGSATVHVIYHTSGLVWMCRERICNEKVDLYRQFY
ncbi:unnamed protein product [Urochloa humidicola]